MMMIELTETSTPATGADFWQMLVVDRPPPPTAEEERFVAGFRFMRALLDEEDSETASTNEEGGF